jgi:hypothetical protein
MPDSIVYVAACRPLAWPWGVFVAGDYAYVATRSHLSIVDVSSPSSPWIVTNFDDGSGPLGVFLADSLAYINDGGWFTIVNVSDPGIPVTVGSCFIPCLTEPRGVSVVGSNAYVAASDSGLQIVNVSDPSSPWIIGRHHTPGRTMDLFVDNSVAYLADRESLQIVDVSDSTVLFRLGAVGTPKSCYDVFVVDTLAYVACESNMGTNGTLQVVNVTDPSNPFIVASVTMNGDPWAVYVSGRYAYVAATDYWALHNGRMAVDDSRPLSADEMVADVEGGVRIVDISDPLSPVLVASYDTPGDPRDVFVVFPYIYVADYDSLQILRHITTGVEEANQRHQVPLFELAQNEPNPFRGSTTISYSLPATCHVTVHVLDVTGRLAETLVDERHDAGVHQIWWDAKDKTIGVYFCRMQAEGFVSTRKMLLMR